MGNTLNILNLRKIHKKYPRAIHARGYLQYDPLFSAKTGSLWVY